MRKMPETRIEQAAAARTAVHAQRPSRARTHAQNANAANRLSVYGTTVKTAVGANSHRVAATTPTRGPPSRHNAQAAKPDPTTEAMIPAAVMSTPMAPAP